MALTTAERRFLREWELQRKGGKLGYFALNMLMWTIICTIALFFAVSYFNLFGTSVFLAFGKMLAIGMVAAFFLTYFIFNKNEKKFKALINREVNLSEQNI